MNAKAQALFDQLASSLSKFEIRERVLPGIANPACRRCFLMQLGDSVGRIRYVQLIRRRAMPAMRIDPDSDGFDPLKGAIWHIQHRDFEEAFWFVFLFVHFGKHNRSGWRAARDVYRGDIVGQPWTWRRIITSSGAFAECLARQLTIWRNDGVARCFGNHRKYESLHGIGAVVESYAGWVCASGTHENLVRNAEKEGCGNGRKAFDLLYQSMNAVIRFGRTARFDYLTMVGKLGLADIEPGCTYLEGATGPVKGARLLLTGSVRSTVGVADLERWLVSLGDCLDVNQQVIEDALCNWQKSPSVFKAFRG